MANRPFKSLAHRLESYQSRMKDAERIRKDRTHLWNLTMRIYRSELVTRYHNNDEHVAVNLVYAWVESNLPSLIFNDPVISAEPLNEEAMAARETTESVVSTELRRAGLKQCLTRSLLDGMIRGPGILQLGYYSSGLVPELGATPDDAQDVMGPIEATKSSDHAYGFRDGRIYVVDHRPTRFLVDPMSQNGDLSDAMWVAPSFIRRLDEVKKDPQYEHTSELQPDTWYNPDQTKLLDGYSQEKPTEHLSDEAFVEIFQVWDISERKVWAFTRDSKKFIGRYDWSIPSKRFPFYPIRLTDDNDNFWCQSPVEPWINLQDELNLILSDRLTHQKRFVRKYIVDKSALDAEDMDKLIQPEDGTIVPVSAEGRPLDQVIKPLVDAPISMDTIMMSNEIMTRFGYISGTSELDMGAMRPGERPAAETQRMAQGSNLRRQGMARRVAWPLADLARDACNTIRKYYTDEQVTQATDEKGAVVWLRSDVSTMSSDYLWTVSIEDMAPKSKQERTQEAIARLQTFGPFGQGGLNIVDLVPLLRDAAKEMGMRELPLLPEAPVAPMDPAYEWFLISKKDREIRPHPAEDLEFHLELHQMQLEAEQQKLQTGEQVNQAATQRLSNHIEETKGLLQAMMLQAEQQAAKGGGAGGQQPPATAPLGAGGPQGPASPPGPAPGSPSNNPAGAGVGDLQAIMEALSAGGGGGGIPG